MPLIRAIEFYSHLKGVRPRLRRAAYRLVVRAWRQRQVDKGRLSYDTPISASATPIPAYVNEGRWLVDCGCGSGIVVFDDDEDGAGDALCLTCGTLWTNVAMPAEAAAIQIALLKRRWLPNRNWRPPETVADLEAQNALHPEGVF